MDGLEKITQTEEFKRRNKRIKVLEKVTGRDKVIRELSKDSKSSKSSQNISQNTSFIESESETGGIDDHAELSHLKEISNN